MGLLGHIEADSLSTEQPKGRSCRRRLRHSRSRAGRLQSCRLCKSPFRQVLVLSQRLATARNRVALSFPVSHCTSCDSALSPDRRPCRQHTGGCRACRCRNHVRDDRSPPRTTTAGRRPQQPSSAPAAGWASADGATAAGQAGVAAGKARRTRRRWHDAVRRRAR